MKRSFLHLAAICLLYSCVWGQQDPTYSQYLFNKLVLNPAYAGSTGELSARLMARWQWVGFTNAPKTQTFSMHVPTPDERQGFGLNFVSDRWGHTQSILFQAAYAYRIPMGGGNLALGLDFGFKNLKVNQTDIAFQDVDPIFGGVNASTTHLVAGPGVYFQNDFFYAGVSMPDILPHNLGSLYAGDADGKAPLHFYGMAGGAIPAGEAVKIRPSALVRVTGGLPLGVDLGLGAMFKDRILAGGIWRPGNAMVFQLQAYVTPKVQIGYAYDMTLKEIRGYSSGSHEIMLGVDLNVFQTSRDVPVRF
jgi:type IX secretion system PorP/SprF family membrane protein